MKSPYPPYPLTPPIQNTIKPPNLTRKLSPPPFFPDWIANLYISPCAQRRGLGRAVMSHLESLVSRSGDDGDGDAALAGTTIALDTPPSAWHIGAWAKENFYDPLNLPMPKVSPPYPLFPLFFFFSSRRLREVKHDIYCMPPSLCIYLSILFFHIYKRE